MGLLGVLRGREQVLFECRHCGTEVVPEADACPNCGSTEIACYIFEVAR